MSRFQVKAATLILLVVLTGCSGDDAGPAATSSPSSTSSAAVPTPATVASPTTATTPATTSATMATAPEGAAPWNVWTLIYASLDTNTHARPAAEAIADEMIEGGAVLLSDDYPSLNPGYWVVFAGEWGSRETAGNQCPLDLDDSLSCYPRYLGDAISTLAADWAVVEHNYALVLVDTTTGEVERTISESLSGDGGFAGSFALDRAHSNLYFGLGYEDWWYSCETAMGNVERLDIETGQREVFSDGWASTISPSGKWLAVVAPSECFPDPDNAGWVLAPGDTIKIYDLEKGDTSPTYTLSTGEIPVEAVWSDPVHGAFWSGNDELVVSMGDNTVRLVSIDATSSLAEAPILFETGDPFLAAVTPSSYLLLNVAGEEKMLLTEVDRATSDIVTVRDFDAWGVGVAINMSGEVLISVSDLLILPSGEEIQLDGHIHNVAW